MSCPAKQSVTPAKNWNAAMTLLTEGLGSHWQHLDQEARSGFQDILEEQNFAYRVVARHIHQLPSMPSIGHRDVVICLIRRFLDQTKGQATVKDAAIYLARSSWDVLLASDRWIDPETYAAIAEDELWGDERNDEANLPHIHEAVRPVVHNDPMTQQMIHYSAREETSDTPASIRTPNIATSDKAVKTAVTTASLDTAAFPASLDRIPAVKGEVRPDKFTIVLGPPDHKTYRKWCFPQHNKGKSFDWQNMEHIRSLNKWRSQIFRRMLGSSKGGPVPFHKDELEWLTELYVLHQQTALHQGLEPNYHTIKWNSITKAFNERFEGQMLSDCEDPRPHRTKSSIQTQRYRIVAISKLTGIPLKKDKTTRRKKPSEAATSGESLKVKSRRRKGTTSMGTHGRKTGKRNTSADTINGSTTNNSTTPVRNNTILDEEEELKEEELSDDATISDVGDA